MSSRDLFDQDEQNQNSNRMTEPESRKGTDFSDEYESYTTVTYDNHILKYTASRDGSKMRIDNIDGKDVDGDEEALLAPEALATWQTIATVQIADIVGTGVLALGSAMANVGWVLGMIMMFIFLPMNIYIGLILGKLKTAYPGAYNSFKLSEFSIGRRWFMWIHYAFFYTGALGLCGAYLQTFAVAFWAVFGTLGNVANMCFWQWQAIGCGILLLFMQLRSFHQGRILYIVNAVSIGLVVFLAAGYMWAHMSDPRDPTAEVPRADSSAIASGMTWRMFVSGMSTFCFAYAGSPIYMEFMAEMQTPSDFPKTFLISSPYQLFFYLISAVTQYAYQGSLAYGKITDALPPGSGLQIAANVLLAIHMVITFLCKGQIMAREFHLKLFPKTVCEFTATARLHWTLCTGLVLAISFLVSNVIPNFNTLLDLLGALQTPFLGFIVPAITFYVSRNRLATFGVPIFRRDWVILAVICLIAIFLMIMGTISAMIEVVQSFQSSNPPFSCITLGQLVNL